MNVQSHMIEVAGGSRKVQVFEAGDGPPLVFLHGAGGLTENSPFLAALARNSHVFAPLLRATAIPKAPRPCATCSPLLCIRSM